jgi:N-methylhydantoinase A
VGETAIERTRERFDELHEKTYNFHLDDPVEVVNLRLTATHPVEKPAMPRVEGGDSLDDARKGTRAVDFDGPGEVDTPVFERERFPAGASVEGPVVVEEPACTTLVTPNQHLSMDDSGNLRISNQ